MKRLLWYKKVALLVTLVFLVLAVPQTVSALAPVADFSASPTNCVYSQSGEIPCVIQFTDLSSNTPTSWDWQGDFGDGWETLYPNGNEQNPSLEIYSGNLLSLPIRLNVTNADGTDTITKENYITITEPTPTPTPTPTTTPNPVVLDSISPGSSVIGQPVLMHFYGSGLTGTIGTVIADTLPEPTEFLAVNESPEVISDSEVVAYFDTSTFPLGTYSALIGNGDQSATLENAFTVTSSGTPTPTPTETLPVPVSCTYTNITGVTIEPNSSGWIVDFGSGKIGTEIIDENSVSMYACGGGVNTTQPTIINYQVSNVTSPVSDYLPVVAMLLGIIAYGRFRKKD